METVLQSDFRVSGGPPVFAVCIQYSLDSVICWLSLLAITAAPQDALLHVSLIFMPEYSVRLLKVRCGK